MRAFVIVKVENKRFPEHISMGQIHSLLFSSGKYRIKCCLVHAGIVTLYIKIAPPPIVKSCC